MKISSYEIYTNSQRQYKSSRESYTRLALTSPRQQTIIPGSGIILDSGNDTSISAAATNKYRSSSFFEMDKAVEISSINRKSAAQAAEKQLVSKIVSHATGGQVSFTQEDVMANISSSNRMRPGFLSSPGRNIVISQMHTESLEEKETTIVNTQGIIETQDGRQIKFGMHLSMERRFSSEKTSFQQISSNQLVDPLVIQFEDGAPSLSDKIFSFDLTGDGKKEELHQLGKGSGFLAFDINGDGQINDGSELFGTKSGNGFADLAKYDEDGNGWIDENDSIFSKLSVWRPEVDGEKGYAKGLLASNVGAIFLGQTQTTHAVTDEKGKTRGMLRSTGMFVKETGETGHVFQMDLASVTSPETRALTHKRKTEQPEAIKKEGTQKNRLAAVQDLLKKLHTSMGNPYVLLDTNPRDSFSDTNESMKERLKRLMGMFGFTPRFSQVA